MNRKLYSMMLLAAMMLPSGAMAGVRPVLRGPARLALPSSPDPSMTFRAPADGETVTPPWTVDFDDMTAPGFTILDTNGDGTTWEPDPMGAGAFSVSTHKLSTDDWLISPPIQLEAGKAYEITLDVFTGIKMSGMNIPSDLPETLEVMWGAEPTAEAMTNYAIEPYDFIEEQQIRGWVIPAETGVVYIGFHGMTQGRNLTINIDKITLSEGREATRPGTVTTLEAKADIMGANEATISFTAPVTDMSGDPLNGQITKIELTRNGALVTTFANPAKGEQLTYTDKDVPTGKHTYGVTAFNENGAGDMATVECVVGPRVPAAPLNVVMTETATDGTVTVTWDEVDLDADGNFLNPATVKYTVSLYCEDETFMTISNDAKPGITFETESSYQQLMRAIVTAHTEAGESPEGLSGLTIAGPSYELPFAESFTDFSLYHAFVTGAVAGEAEWALMGDGSGIPSQDLDNGFMVMLSDPGSSAFLESGKIDLAGCAKPCLTFYTYNIARLAPAYPDDNELIVSIRKAGDSNFTEVRRVVMSELGDNEGWYRVTVPLTQYKDQKITLRFTGVGHGMTYTLLDNICVGTIADNDLAAKSISAPDVVKPGMTAPIVLEIENMGFETAKSYTVDLICNSEYIGSVKGTEIAPGATATLRYSYKVSPLADKDLRIIAQIQFGKDSDPDNNIIGPAETEVHTSGLPMVGNLTAKGATLSWSAPDLTESASDFIMEDFESAEPWATGEACGWTFVDADQALIGEVENFPGIEARSTQSWFVVDGGNFDPVMFAAHSGSKFIGQVFAMTEYGNLNTLTCDDWAISPELPGDAQTVSFWARSLNAAVHDSFEVLASEGGTELSDFKRIDGRDEIPANWQKYTFRLPEGTRRMAIRSVSDACYMMLVDDINFTRSIDPSELTLTGYNIYCDGSRLNRTPVTATTYTDAANPDANSTYAVTAVYDKGESAAATVLASTAAESIAAAQPAIAVRGNAITATGADGMTMAVYSADGRLFASTRCSASTGVTVAPGVYVVTLTGRDTTAPVTAKVVVR